ncbi:MAG: YdcH family protein [Acidobacteria bacterium]|nr:YdcH family protein [Acidobacteriota bacterium]
MTASETQEAKSQLLQQDGRYRELDSEHHQLDLRLHALTEKSYLSTSEQLEEVTFKKRKLVLKDRMERMARDHGKARGPTTQ